MVIFSVAVTLRSFLKKMSLSGPSQMYFDTWAEILAPQGLHENFIMSFNETSI